MGRLASESAAHGPPPKSPGSCAYTAVAGALQLGMHMPMSMAGLPSMDALSRVVSAPFVLAALAVGDTKPASDCAKWLTSTAAVNAN